MEVGAYRFWKYSYFLNFHLLLIFQIITKALTWLLKHQTEDGAFYDETWIPDRKANISVHVLGDTVQHKNISLTAHVLITLSTVKDVGVSNIE